MAAETQRVANQALFAASEAKAGRMPPWPEAFDPAKIGKEPFSKCEHKQWLIKVGSDLWCRSLQAGTDAAMPLATGLEQDQEPANAGAITKQSAEPSKKEVPEQAEHGEVVVGEKQVNVVQKKLVRLEDDPERIECTLEDETEEDVESDLDQNIPKKANSMPALSTQEFASIGSEGHADGMCTPCAWFWKPKSCLNEKDCRYCHLCPDGELKKRKKNKVAKMRLGLLSPKGNGSDQQVTRTLSLAALL